jgi:hypothetical protein
VLAQVQLSRLFGVKKGHSFQAHNNRINRTLAITDYYEHSSRFSFWHTVIMMAIKFIPRL